MAIGTYYGVQYTKAYRTVPNDPVHASYMGKTMTMMDTVESAAAIGLDAGSTVTMFRPPKGARWSGEGAIWSDALGTGVTLSVGISGAAAMFGAATSHASAAKTLLGLAANIDAVMYEFDGATDVIVTSGGAAMITDRTITLMMQFVVA